MNGCCTYFLLLVFKIFCFLFFEKNQEQKDAIEKGLVSMEDVEMAASQGTSQNIFAICFFLCMIYLKVY